MKRIAQYLIAFMATLTIVFTAELANSQCNFYIKIDGNQVYAEGAASAAGLQLPVWLKAGQTLQTDVNVHSISVLEFTINGSALAYSQTLSVTSTLSTVPAGKTWKIESIIKEFIRSNC